MIEIYTDGACSGNPGKGASAFIVVGENGEVHHRGARTFERTTNNIAEMTAVMLAIDYVIAENETECKIHSDSQYVVNGINVWMWKWALHGWMGSSKHEIKNAELWQKIYALWNMAKGESNISIHYVKAHHTNKWNLLVDKFATTAVKMMK